MSARRKAEWRGRMSEVAAALWLMAHGYRILARRARTPFGEIDLIAFKNRVVCFVEVKARATRTEALAAMSARQWRRSAQAAQYWMGCRGWDHPDSGLGWRYDLIAVPRRGAWTHVRDAYRPEAD